MPTHNNKSLSVDLNHITALYFVFVCGWFDWKRRKQTTNDHNLIRPEDIVCLVRPSLTRSSCKRANRLQTVHQFVKKIQSKNDCKIENFLKHLFFKAWIPSLKYFLIDVKEKNALLFHASDSVSYERMCLQTGSVWSYRSVEGQKERKSAFDVSITLCWKVGKV